MDLEFDASPVRQRLTASSEALDLLVAEVEAGGLNHLDAAGLVAFLQDLEAVRNRLPWLDHRALLDAAERDVAGALGQGRLTRVLTQALRISAGEASRRVQASEQVGDRATLLAPYSLPIPSGRARLDLRGRQVHAGGMNLLCVVGRHRWMTRQGKDELGKPVTFQQCERCLHYPKTSSWLQRDPQKWEGGGMGDPGNSGGGSVAV